MYHCISSFTQNENPFFEKILIVLVKKTGEDWNWEKKFLPCKICFKDLNG